MMRRGRTTQSRMDESRRMFWEMVEWGTAYACWDSSDDAKDADALPDMLMMESRCVSLYVWIDGSMSGNESDD